MEAISPAIVDEKGKPRLGLWHGEICQVNPLDYSAGLLFSCIKTVREKRWQYVGIYGQEIQMGLAVVHTGYLGTVFCYFYDRQSESFIEIEKTIPLALGFRFDRNVCNGIASFKSSKDFLRITNDVGKNKRHIEGTIRRATDSIILDVTLIDSMKEVVPLQVVTPTVSGDFSFTHKAAGLPIEGSVEVNGQKFNFNESRDFGAIDYTFGFPAYHTVWRWASLAGTAQDGTVVGLNLVSPVYHDEYNENCLWLNGQMIKTGKATFQYNPKDTLDVWKIKTEDKSVNLVFQPSGKRQQHINAIIIGTTFQQPYGLFSGTLRDTTGNEFILENVPGVVEDHEAYW